MDIITQRGHVLQGLVPLSRAMNTSSDIINVANYHDITFYIVKGAGAAGTATITVDVCDTVGPGNTAKCGYKYRRQADGDDLWGAVTDRTAAQNFVTTAEANGIYEISVDTQEIGNVTVNALKGNHYVRLSIVQSIATAVTYGVFVVLGRPRYPQDVPITAIV